MRKFCVTLLLIATLFTAVGCSDGAVNTGRKNDDCSHEWEDATCTEPKTCEKCDETKGDELGHTWIEATCLEPKVCSVCEKTEGEALGHTTDSGTCYRCGEAFGDWIEGEFKDEFDRPTGEKYVASYASGKFSNSATTNSELNAAIQITSDYASIMLWEYGNNIVNCYYDKNEYDITVLDTYENKHYFTGNMYEGGTRILLSGNNRTKFINLLEQSGTLKFYIVNDKYITSTYSFSVETGNFSSLYDKVF